MTYTAKTCTKFRRRFKYKRINRFLSRLWYVYKYNNEVYYTNRNPNKLGEVIRLSISDGFVKRRYDSGAMNIKTSTRYKERYD